MSGVMSGAKSGTKSGPVFAPDQPASDSEACSDVGNVGHPATEAQGDGLEASAQTTPVPGSSATRPDGDAALGEGAGAGAGSGAGEDDALMSPLASPDHLAGVRRVNNLPLFILGGVLLMFVAIMVVVASKRGQPSSSATSPPVGAGGDSLVYAREIAAGPGHGADAPPALIPSEQPVIVAMPGDTLSPPSPTDPANMAPGPVLGSGATGGAGPTGLAPAGVRDEEALRLQQQKVQQLEEAAKAKTSVRFTAPSAQRDGSVNATLSPSTRSDMLERIAQVQRQLGGATSDNPSQAYQTRLAQLRGHGDWGGGVGGGGGTGGMLAVAGPGRSSGLSAFDRAGSADRWRLDAQPEAPRTPYELRAGFVVPATLISGINSDLPGTLMAQVAQHVYDTPTGQHLLIPQGTRLVGAYSSDVAYGQARVLVAWQRLVFPDGKAMDIGAMPGADGAGRAGLHDQVNNHYLRLFGSAFLLSGVTAGITYSQQQGQGSTNERSASAALSEALGQQLGQVTAQLLTKNMNISPTLEIRPGARFNVVVTKDLTFTHPYQSFDY